MPTPRLRFLNSALACLLLAFLTAPAHAATQDAAATRLAESAMSEDYVGTRFKDADKKLKKALKLCGKKNCSPEVLARIHRDLGVVAIAGLKKPKPGKAAFSKAIELDASIRLDPDVTTPEVEQAWKEAGGEGLTPDPPPESEQKIELEAPAEAKPAPEPEPSAAYKLNWVSLALQQDMLYHGRDTEACYSGNYTCFDGAGDQYTGPIYTGYGNEVKPGIGFGTTRVLLGYDRALLPNLLAGARFGFAFGGAPTLSSGRKFLPFHAELKGSYFFGEEPLAKPGLRPFAALGAGIAEVDTSTAVDYYADQTAFEAGDKQTLVGWRKTGKMFVAPGIGTHYGFGSASALVLELRGLLMVGTSALGAALSIGYAHGI